MKRFTFQVPPLWGLLLFGACSSSLFCLQGGCSDDSGNGPACGNDVREEGENCDGADLGGESCASLGVGVGDLACNEDCSFDRTECSFGSICGDGLIGGMEDCEGADLDGETCVSLGYSSGVLICDGNCHFDVSDCSGTGLECGNGVKEGQEECDGDDLDGYDCIMLGFAGGQLACSDVCLFDTSGCTS